MAVRKDEPVLKSILSKGIQSVSAEDRRALENKWLGNNWVFEVPWAQAHLTDAELAWLNGHREIRLGVHASYPPFEGVDGKGAFTGMTADYVNLIAKRLGINMRPMVDIPWADAIDAIKQRRVDMLPAFTPLVEREQFFDFTDTYLVFPVVILTREGHSLIAGLADLRGRPVALPAGFATFDEIKSRFPDIRLQIAEGSLQALRAVADGTADATVMNLGTASYLIGQNNIQGLVVAAPAGLKAPGLAMGVRKDWPELAPILNKVFASISAEEEIAIRGKWIIAPYDARLAAASARQTLALVLAAGGIIAIAVLGWVVWLKRQAWLRQQEAGRAAAKEAELRDIFERSPVSGVIVGLAGVIRYANPAFLNLLERTAEELRDIRMEELYFDPAEREPIVNAAVVSGSVHNVEVRFKTKHGNMLHLLLSADFYSYQNEKCLVSWLVDITGRKRAENDLAAQMSFQSTLMENLPVCVSYKDDEARFYGCNRAYEEFYGVSRLDIVGKTVADNPMFTEAQGQRLYAEDVEALRTGEVLNEAPRQLVAADGSIRDLLLWRIPFRFPDGTPAGLLNITVDVSTQKKVERALTEAEGRLRELTNSVPGAVFQLRFASRRTGGVATRS